MKKKPGRGRPPGSKTRKGIKAQTTLKREKGAHISVSLNEDDFNAMVASGEGPTQFVRGLRQAAASVTSLQGMKDELEASILSLLDKKIPKVKSPSPTEEGNTIEPSQLNGFIDFISYLPAIASFHELILPNEIDDALVDSADGHLIGFWKDLRDRLLTGLATEYEPGDELKALRYETHWAMVAFFLDVFKRVRVSPVHWGIAPLHALRYHAVMRIFFDVIRTIGEEIFDQRIKESHQRLEGARISAVQKRLEVSKRYGIPPERWPTSAPSRPVI